MSFTVLPTPITDNHKNFEYIESNQICQHTPRISMVSCERMYKHMLGQYLWRHYQQRNYWLIWIDYFLPLFFIDEKLNIISQHDMNVCANVTIKRVVKFCVCSTAIICTIVAFFLIGCTSPFIPGLRQMVSWQHTTELQSRYSPQYFFKKELDTETFWIKTPQNLNTFPMLKVIWVKYQCRDKKKIWTLL